MPLECCVDVFAVSCSLLPCLLLGLRPHLDLRYVRDHVDAVESNLLSRGSGAFASAHRVKELYEQSIAMEYEVAQVRKQRNSIGKKFGQAKTQEEKE